MLRAWRWSTACGTAHILFQQFAELIFSEVYLLINQNISGQSEIPLRDARRVYLQANAAVFHIVPLFIEGQAGSAAQNVDAGSAGGAFCVAAQLVRDLLR